MTEIKQGMLKYYHRGLLSKKWKEYKCILYDSSLLTWYSDVKHKKPDGMVLLKDVEQYICVGPYTKYLPDFPRLDDACDQVALIAFPISVKDRDHDLVWLLCEDLDDLNSWMKAIVQTLPSHSLNMEKYTKVSSPSTDETIETISETNSSEIESAEPIIIKADAIDLPLSAGIIGAHLQGRAMNSKNNQLERTGYDYGDTVWGTGEGWGCSSALTVPGFAGFAGGGPYSNHIELLNDDDDDNNEQQIEATENHTGQAVDDDDDDDVVKEATYELSKNEIDDQEDEEHYGSDHAGLAEFDNDFKMIDSDADK